jgi:hypothetical protein
MKRISDIRTALETIPDVFYDRDPEDASRGNQAGVRSIWEGRMEVEFVDAVAPSEETLESEVSIPHFEELLEYGAEIDLDLIRDVMGGTAGSDIQRSVQVRGVDALAWYVTFHVRGAQWGIYMPLSSIAFMIGRVFSSINAAPEDLLKLAVRSLHQHELFHFAMDYASSQVEILTKRPCHKPARSLRDERYNYIVLEERLANANMIRSFWGRRLRGKTQALRDFVSMQPPGYRDAPQSTEGTAFRQDCDLLAGRYVNSVGEHSHQALSGLDGVGVLSRMPVDWRYCPIHVISDEHTCGLDSRWLDLFQRIEAVAESERFRKYLSRMPKPVQANWEEVKSRLSHTTAGAGLDFKFWKRTTEGSIYSVRLSRQHRAHLVVDRKTRGWTAVDLGTHSAMGHG